MTDVVVIGGGVVGVSTAFHLAEAGAAVTLLERDVLGSGSTSRAAGGVRATFSDPVNIALGLRSLEAFERFGTRPGAEIDLRQHGYLFLLDDPDDVAAFEAGVSLQNSMGVPSRMISPAEARGLSPFISAEGLVAATWSPRDGHCTPEAVVRGYAVAARRLGATIRQHCTVTGIVVDGGDIVGVRTDQEFIRASTVVCAAGAWSGAIGDMVGVSLPVKPLRRQIRVTGPLAVPPGLPFTIDFGTTFYFHAEGPGLLIGMSDPDQEYGFDTRTSDEWLERLGAAAARRAPALTEVGIARGWAGLYEVSPDHNAIIGESSAVSRFLYATGFSGHGFLQGPAVGEVVRDLVLGRPPVVDVSSLDVTRFGAGAARPERNVV
ncbi:NAD(P)/FAD-dependent oxidoreductase [Kibdelosporangium phytohabitans]|uniref:Sarcosine oxidase subunit beta n=1 Tax=Kibdelosporangium phytohabitans TaxID=860235 RepID=A0A0N9I428_9PSEU|nr:FAD-binding oxidoreductase [Kibdelosporangium phytohabitans]ALG09088.1 sarcosine oxidase subunit beta [Kibdelosporangium phytohabitans]MBE1469718.1 sarcosine oxidase subunit beta [Kibdelosporangium phytohabitans]